MPSIGPYGASIIVNKRPLQEYFTAPTALLDNQPGISHCYVEAVDGAEFGVKVALKDSRAPNVLVTRAKVYLNGAMIAEEHVLPPYPGEMSGSKLVNHSDKRIGGQWCKVYMAFIAATAVDGRTKDNDYGTGIGSAGTIKVIFEDWVESLPTLPTVVPTVLCVVGDTPSEAVSKSNWIDMTAQFVVRAPSPAGQETTSISPRLEPSSTHSATFVFHYRSLAALIALGVMKDESRDADDTRDDIARMKEDVDHKPTTHVAGVSVKPEPAADSSKSVNIDTVPQADTDIKLESSGSTKVKQESLKHEKKRTFIEISDDEEDITCVEERPCKTVRRPFQPGLDEMEDLTGA